MNDSHVLVVDTDDAARKGLAQYLHTVAKIQVTQCENGDVVLEQLIKGWRDYTAILLDYTLKPPTSGEKVLVTIRNRYPELPVIVFTGRDPKGGIQALEQGAYRYLRRPLNLPEIVSIVRNLAEQDMVFLAMARDMRMMLKSDACLAWRLDKRQRRLRVVAWDGDTDVNEEYRKNAFLDVRDRATWRLLSQGKPIACEDADNLSSILGARHAEQATAQGWCSAVIVPLVRQEQIVGLIESYTREPRKLPAEQREQWLEVILPVFGRQAAQAIKNVEMSDQLQALQGISDVQAGTFGEQRIVRQILSKALELAGADFGWIYRVDNNLERLVLEEMHGIERKLVDEQRELNEGITGWVATHGETRWADDVTRDTRYKAILGVEARSAVAVPIRREELTIGVLAAMSRFTNAFSSDDVDLLSSFAAQAGVVIQNARVFEHSQKIGTLAIAGDYDKLADYVVEAARELTGADAVLWMMSDREDERGTFLRVRAIRGKFDKGYKDTAFLPLAPGRSITSLALERGEPVIRQDILDDSEQPGEPRFHNMDEAKRQEWRSFVAVPLFGRQGQTLGSLNLHAKEVAKFGEPEVALIQAFTNHVAIALENAKIIDRLSTQLRRLHQAGQTRREEDVLQSVLDGLKDIFFDAPCAVREYDSRTKQFGRRIAAGRPLDVSFQEPRSDGSSRYVVEVSKAPLYADDAMVWLPNGQPVIREDLLKAGVESVAYLPLRTQDDVVGILYVDLTIPYHFSDSDREVLELFASQAAVAIQNTRFFQELDARAQQFERLQQVTTAISAEPFDLAKVLDLVVRGLGDIFSGASCSVRLYDPERDQFGKWFATGPLKETWSRPRRRGASWSVVNAKSPLYITDTKLPRPKGQPSIIPSLMKKGVRAVAYLPLRKEEKVVGVLYLNLTEPREFSKDERRLLGLFADQAAMAIDNARLYTELSLQSKQRKILLENNSRIMKVDIGDVDRLLDLLYDVACEVMDLSDAQVQFAFYDAAKDEVTFPLAIEKDDGALIDGIRWGIREPAFRRTGEDEAVPAFQPRSRGSRFGLTEYVIHTRATSFIPTNFLETADALRIGEQQVRVLPVFGRLERLTHSWLAVPMVIQGKVIGVISIQSLEHERAFSQEQIDLLTIVANQAAVAIENARLYANAAELNAQLQRNIDELKRIQVEIANKERALVLTTVAADFVHKMNNLAGTIPNWVSLASSQLKTIGRRDQEIRVCLTRIAEDARFILREARRLRDPLPQPEYVHMDEIVGAIVDQMQLIAPPGIVFVVTSFLKNYLVHAIRTQISDAVYNIVDNAVRAIEGEGTVSITVVGEADKDEQVVKVEVTDTGCGIAQDRLARIFEMGTTYRPDGSGMGYGLWRARNIIESLRGQISAVSQLGKGSTFMIVLPAHVPDELPKEGSTYEG